MLRYFGSEKSEGNQKKSSKLNKNVRPKNKSNRVIDHVREDVFDPYHGPTPINNEILEKYQRGKRLDVRGIKTKSKKIELIKADKKIRQSMKQAARNELFLPEQVGYLEPDDNEDTFRVEQSDLSDAVDITSASKMLRYFGSEKSEGNQKKSSKLNKNVRPKNKSNRVIDHVREDVFDPYHGPTPINNEILEKYQRGKRLDVRGIKTKSKKIELIKADKKIRQSMKQAARNELFLPEQVGYLEPDDNEDTFRVEQSDLSDAVDITSASKLFSLSLTEFGPYKINYSRDGRHLLLGGHRGHVAAMDWVTKRLLCEVNVMESIHDLCWLHLPTMFATAQKEWVYVYDNKGVELHCVKQLHRVLQMQFLPYHFLLVTASEKSFLSWLDVSIGKIVKETYTNCGRLSVMCQNPYNAIVATGHPNGSVSMWSPNVDKPLVRILCNPHPIKSITIDSKGLYLATASIDRSLKIYDVRTYKCLQSYKLAACAGFLDFSQMGMLGVGLGNVVEVYKDCCTQTVTAPYMRHKTTTTVSDIQFCPYEDVLGVGYSSGFNSTLIPGSGQPNFDAYESNPFMTKSQRREMEVKSLLEKIQPELITLNPAHLGTINVPSLKEKMEQKRSLLHVKPKTVEFEPRPKPTRSTSFKSKKIIEETAKRDLIKSSIKEKALTKKISSKQFGVLDRFKPRFK